MTQQHRSALVPQRLSSGSAASVLVVDFQPFVSGRRLGELLAAEDLDRSVYQLEPARDLAGRPGYTSLAELAAEYTESFLRLDQAASTTVLGYCSGAILALRIAELLAAERPVAVTLLRPTWPGLDTIAGMLATVRAELGTSTGPPPELTGAPATVLAGIDQLLQAELRALAERHGLDPGSGPLLELAERYRGWFGYLLAAQDAGGARPVPGVALELLLDQDEPCDVAGIEPGGYRCRRFALPADDAQATERLAAVLAQQLRAPGS